MKIVSGSDLSNWVTSKILCIPANDPPHLFEFYFFIFRDIGGVYLTNMPYISNYPFKIGEGAYTLECTVSQMRDFDEH